MIKRAYVHTPFCSSLCSYCAFEKSLNLQHIPRWLDTIESEIRKELWQHAGADPDFVLDSIYFGGGTPSVLSPVQMERLCALFTPYIHEKTEWTVEVNPESVSPELLSVLKNAGVNRISIGVQSLNDDLLRTIGRKHSAAQAVDAIERIRDAGISNISADIITALPGQSETMLEEDLQKFVSLNLPHLSVYTLILEEHSVFGKTGVEPADEEQEALFYEKTVQFLKEAGYEHYEVSSFCKDQKKSAHNSAYWKDENYFGFGFGASGRDEKGTYHHKGSLADYLKAGYQKEYDTDQNRAFCAIMTGLRLFEGMEISQWNARYHDRLEKRAEAVMEKFPDSLRIEEGRLQCSEHGMEILDSLLLEFLEQDW
jgi:oxygen-independent coproporphyrinogen-3 oxidase